LLFGADNGVCDLFHTPFEAIFLAVVSVNDTHPVERGRMVFLAQPAVMSTKTEAMKNSLFLFMFFFIKEGRL